MLKRATKLVHFTRNMSYNDRLKALNIPSLSNRRFRCDMFKDFVVTCSKFIKLLTNKEDIEYGRFFKLNIKVPTRGHITNYKKKKKKKKKILYKGNSQEFFIKSYLSTDGLQISIVNIPTNAFKNRRQIYWR